MRLSTGGTSATAGADYVSRTNAAVVVPAGQTSAFFDVVTLSDQLVEGSESVSADIKSVTGGVLGGSSNASGLIFDVPPVRASLRPATSVSEGATLRFPVTLNRVSAADVTVRVSTGGGSATAGADYVSRTNAAVVVPAGQTSGFFDVVTLSDQLVEGSESVSAEVKSVTGGVLGGSSNASGLIFDVPPVLARGKRVGGKRISGVVKVKPPGGGQYTDLGAEAVLPIGTQVDATKGVIELISAVGPNAKLARASAKRTQRARFSKGIFTIRQTRRSALVTLVLSGPELRGCGHASARNKVRRLWGDGKGRFRTKGKYAAGTIRGARWLTEDRCGSTRVKVTRGRVTVRDLARKRTRVARAGHSVTVRAKR